MTEIAEGAQDRWRWPRYEAGDVTPSAFNLLAMVVIESPAA
jgi:hypothetical protein